ncbi:alkylmercury lyase family protein [Mycobacteroides abscessus subsp. bolletii]|uniref:alkylmercury lyase family protein n=1 Tax=Mycobacteroides abscessus TaxID=36809 RepID=UPI0019D14D05|nr:alkylmercury lyase family protein [Mycobacteroides abscessus]MBN7303155.1 alkylmercury lyase family protein [Mycobacteroides abscessus subsp. bolletii]
MAELSVSARAIRARIMDQVRGSGTAPTIRELREEFGLTSSELDSVLRDLEGAICVAIQDEEHADSPLFQDEPFAQPALGEIVYARPFANFENHYRVTVDGLQRWYAECAVEACAISGQFPGAEVVVTSTCRQTGTPIRLVGHNGVLVDFEPATLRVHLAYPVREMPHRVVGWCDYNSFFASEDAANEWRKSHPEINGVTRSPLEMSRLINEFLAVGRLHYDYQPQVPLLTLMRKGTRFGIYRRTWFGIPVPDPFWMPTLRMALHWKRRGLGNFFRFQLR